MNIFRYSFGHFKPYKLYDLAIDGYQVTSSKINMSAEFCYDTELEIYYYYFLLIIIINLGHSLHKHFS